MLEIIYEDNHILVVVKPHNVPSQEDSSGDKDMLTMVKEYIKEKYNKEGNVYAGLVHRLDRPTGGLMVFAKTSKAAARLSDDIKNHKMVKKYLCVLCGVPVYKSGKLEHYLKKDQKTNIVSIVPRAIDGAKKAELEYEILDTFEDKISLASVVLHTGRSHQIRVQMASQKTPLFSDKKYGATMGERNLALFAYYLEFNHPTKKDTLKFYAMPDLEHDGFQYFDKKIKSLYI